MFSVLATPVSGLDWIVFWQSAPSCDPDEIGDPFTAKRTMPKFNKNQTQHRNRTMKDKPCPK